MPATQLAALRAGQRSIWSADLGSFLQPDQYVFLTHGGTLWSWPGQNPFRWRDPSGRMIPQGAINDEGSRFLGGAAQWIGSEGFREWGQGNYGSAILNFASSAVLFAASAFDSPQVSMALGGVGTGVKLGAAAVGECGAVAGGKEMVSLYRAVGDAELKVIQSSGGKIPASLSGLESKYFSATAEGAASYARQAVRNFGDAPYTLIETQAARSALPTQTLLQVDRNVPAVVLPNTHLQSLAPAKTWTYMPIP